MSCGGSVGEVHSHIAEVWWLRRLMRLFTGTQPRVPGFECLGPPKDISMDLLRLVANIIGFPLAHIFNLSLQQGIFPDKLKQSEIVPIHKSGKLDSSDNYRPIALLNSISKILKK